MPNIPIEIVPWITNDLHHWLEDVRDLCWSHEMVHDEESEERNKNGRAYWKIRSTTYAVRFINNEQWYTKRFSREDLQQRKA